MTHPLRAGSGGRILRGELDRGMQEFASHGSEIEMIVSLARSVVRGRKGA